MSLDEPQVFVEVARDPGEQVGGVGIAERRGLLDPGAHRLAERRRVQGQLFIGDLQAVERIGRQGRAAGPRRSGN